MSHIIRRMTQADWPAADLVARAAFERDASFLPYLALHATIQPDGMWVAAADKTIVGTVTAIHYGAVGYIGIMTVHPDYQSRGLGRALLQEALGMLKQRQCPVALLDATEKGARLYETVDFVDDSVAKVFELAPSLPAVAASGASGAARLAKSADFEDIVACDALAFGANREKLLTALWKEFRERCLVTRDRSGHLAGYVFARDGVWGPWAAMAELAASELLSAALALPRQNTPLVMVPRSNVDAQRLLTAHGFVERRTLRHMRCGGNASPGQPSRLYGQSSFGHG